MKKIFISLGLVVMAVMLVGLVPFNAEATPINGDIAFAGAVTFDNNNLLLATMITSFPFAVVTSSDGDYSSITAGTGVTVTPFTFNPVTPSITPLWFLTATPGWDFNATSMNVKDQHTNHVDIFGTGIADIPGFDPTPGTYILSFDASGTAFSFAAANGVHGVPEPLTLTLLGAGLVGLFGLKRKLS
jgi:hypothetical protein